jgi:pilus assembly protein CpaF
MTKQTSANVPIRKAQELEDHIHFYLSEQLERKLVTDEEHEIPDRQELTRRAAAILREKEEILTARETKTVVCAVVDRIVGLGPLEPLLEDPSINKIMVNDPESIFIERDGGTNGHSGGS